MNNKMIYKLSTIVLILVLQTVYADAQTVQEKKFGEVFYLSIPDTYKPIKQLIDGALMQYKHIEKPVFLYIVDDSKEVMKLHDVEFVGIADYVQNFMENKKAIKSLRALRFSTPKPLKIANLDAVYLEMYYKQDKVDMTSMVYIIETPGYYYEIGMFALSDLLTKSRVEFENIGNSFRLP